MTTARRLVVILPARVAGDAQARCRSFDGAGVFGTPRVAEL